MSDDQVVKLLEEIRDIQRENTVNYKVALQNQQESMAMQKRAVQRSKAAFVGLVVLFMFLGGTYLLSIFSWFFSWTLRH